MHVDASKLSSMCVEISTLSAVNRVLVQANDVRAVYVVGLLIDVEDGFHTAPVGNYRLVQSNNSSISSKLAVALG
jgi:hypothetical protein